MDQFKEFFVSPDSGEKLISLEGGLFRSPSGESFSVENDIPILIPEKSLKVFNENAYRSDFKYFKFFDKSFVTYLVAKLNLKKGALMLDLGGGEGFYAHCFSTHGIQVITGDFSKYLLQKGKSKYPDLSFVGVDAHQIPFQNEIFDIIFCSGLSLFNTPDLLGKKELISHFMSKLKPDGVLIFSHSTNLTGRKDGTWYPITKKDLDALFSQQKIIHRWFVPRFLVTNILGALSFTNSSSLFFGAIIKRLSFLHRKIRGRIIYVIKK